MSRCFLLVVACAVSFVLPLHARGAQEEGAEIEPPEDPRDAYVVGFQTLEDLGLTAGSRVLVRTIPEMMRRELAQLPDHSLSAEEQEALARHLLEEAAREAGEEVDRAVEARDSILFEPGREDERRRELEQAEEDLKQARDDLETVRAFEVDDVEVDEMKPLSFGEQDAELLDAGGAPPRVARDEDLDLLITGSIEEVETTLVLRVRVYSRFLERYVFDRRIAGAPGADEKLVSPLRDGLAAVLLGREFGRLSVTTGTEETAIYVDDRLVGFGDATVEYARTGSREVRASRDGYRELSREVEVAAGESKTISFLFPVAAEGDVNIETDPSGADVYLGSIWQGVTPLTLARPSAPRTIIVEEEGFLEETIIVTPNSPAAVRRNLVPDPGDWPQRVEERRDRFYRSLGWFALSLPFPIILNGMFNDIATLFPGGEPAEDLSTEEAARLARTANTLLWSARATGAVSGGLFVNMMIRLIQYVRVGQYSHDENPGVSTDRGAVDGR